MSNLYETSKVANEDYPLPEMPTIGYDGTLGPSSYETTEFTQSRDVPLYEPVPLSGEVSPSGAANVVGSVRAGTASSTAAPQYTIYNQGSYPVNSAANYPVSNPQYSWATPYATTLTKTGAGAPSSGITVSQKPYATIQETKTVYPSGKAPEFTAPAYNEKEIRKRARQLGAPQRAALEMKVQAALSKYYENPNVRRMVLRDTLAGYGIGLASIMGQAEQTATQQYGAEHARLYSEAMNSYNVSMQKYLSEAKQVTSQRTVPTEAAYDKAMTTV